MRIQHINIQLKYLLLFLFLPQGAYFPKALFDAPEWQPNLHVYIGLMVRVNGEPIYT